MAQGYANLPGEKAGPGELLEAHLTRLKLLTSVSRISGGEGFLVAEGLDDYDYRRGHGLGQLIGAYGVILQR